MLERDDKAFLKNIKENIRRQRGRELPRFVSYKACVNLIRDIVAKFDVPAQECIVEVSDLVGQLYGQVAHHSLGQYHDLEMRIRVGCCRLLFTIDIYFSFV